MLCLPTALRRLQLPGIAATAFPMEKGKLGPQPPERHLLKDVAAGTGGDEADSGPVQPSPSHTSRVSFSSRLQVRHTPSPAPPDRGDRSSRHGPPQQSAGSQPSSGRVLRGPGPRSRVCSPGPLPPPANAAARGQCRRLRSCAACSGRASLDTSLALPSAPHTPASTEPPPVLIDRSTQTEPPAPVRCGAAERVDRGTQTESPVQKRHDPRVPLLMDQGTQTELPVLLPSTAPAAPRAPEPPGRRQRFSLFRRLLRACRGSFSRAQPEQLESKWPQHPPRAPPAFAPGIGVLMVLQEPAQDAEWYPFSWPWLVETSL